MRDVEKNRRAAATWYARNRERRIANVRRWQAEHPDAVARYREIARTPEKRAEQRARVRRWQAMHPELTRAYKRSWNRRNRVHRQLGLVAYRSRRRLAAGRFTAAQWRELLAVWSHTCAYCGMGGRLTVDHRVPLSRGGSNDIGNILPACHGCNSTKRHLTEEEFRAWRRAQLRAAA